MKKLTKLIGIFLSIILIVINTASSNFVYAETALSSVEGTSAEITAASGYSTLSAAVKAFAESIYCRSEYVKIEYGAILYKLGSTYYYDCVQSGYPHYVEIEGSYPKSATFLGIIHTHPNSEEFSDTDIAAISSSNCPGYLVTKSYKVLKYDPSTEATTVYLSSFVPNTLTSSQKSELVTSFSDIWYGHFENGNCPKGFDCSNMQWPNDSSTRHGNTVYTWTENHYHSYDMHYYEYGFKCTHCNTFVYTEWTPLPCRGGTFCITPWNLRDEPLAA